MGLWDELEWRGMVHQSTDPTLGRRLEDEAFTVYNGFDATADSLHAGHLVPVIGLQRHQRAGPGRLVVVGGAPPVGGEPRGREAARPLLSTEQIEVNSAAIREQLERFLDFSPGASQAVVLDNHDWLGGLQLTGFLRDVGRHFTVNTMMAKDSVRSRLDHREQGMSYTEFSYMLLQAYDYLHLFELFDCRLQTGGSDQWGNITAGIELIRRARGERVDGLTWPLLTRADGTKFGKSEGVNVWLDPARTSPYRFYQYWRNTADADLDRSLRLFTDLARSEIEVLLAEPRRAQQRLAWEVTARVHGRAEADRAGAAAAVLFDGGELAALDDDLLPEVFAEAPSSVASHGDLSGEGVAVVDLVARTGLTPSKSAARAAIAQGGLYLNDRRVSELDRRVTTHDLLHGRWLVLRKGKKSYHLVRFE